MNAIIACSPSSGSSLLCQLLNRHPEIYCGPESNLFIYPDLFNDWGSQKNKINTKGKAILNGFRNLSFYVQPKLFIEDNRGLNVEELIKSSSSLKEFSSAYLTSFSKEYSKRLWVEKTPANALCLPLISREFKQDIILATIVRDPFDCIYSMYRRGMSLYRSVSSYLLYNAHILSTKGIHLIKYEELVDRPEEILGAFLRKMNLAYHPDMLVSSEKEEAIQMKGWTYAENRAIGKSAIGKFSSAPAEVQSQILHAIDSSEINENYLKQQNLEYRNIREIAKELGYELTEEYKALSNSTFRTKILKDQAKYLFTRWKSGAFSYGLNYPVVISNVG